MIYPTVIGLMGYKRAGKDTVADHLVNAHGYTRIAHADILRDMLWELNPLFVDGTGGAWRLARYLGANTTEAWEDFKTSEPDAYRDLLRTHGAVIGSRAPDFFVDQVWEQINYTDRATRWVITDVRFPAEARKFTSPIHQRWRITRPGVVGDGHPSEVALDKWPADRASYNDGTIADLHHAVDEALS